MLQGSPAMFSKTTKLGPAPSLMARTGMDMYTSLKAMNIEEEEDGENETWEVDDEELESAETGQE